MWTRIVFKTSKKKVAFSNGYAWTGPTSFFPGGELGDELTHKKTAAKESALKKKAVEIASSVNQRGW